ncbi:MAG: NAD(P)/FAD-dependent oxidoreductase [Spirochaetes bacterium]|nr:MAG: NAD(P)/FAD-dependent oxidoreductase [Spirochaetota bacterium]
MKRVAIIGGGASGLIAAHFCARGGCRVTVFERQKSAGRKLLATGNGRCNIANRELDADRYHGHNPRFAGNVIARFGLDETTEFFRSIGIPFVEGERGKLYPASLQASSVQRVLIWEIGRLGADIHLHRKVDSIQPRNGKFLLVTSGLEELEFDAVVLAAGSCAAPQLGASTAGYELASSLGHRVYEPFPAILPISIPLKALHRLEGIKWDCGVSVRARGKTIAESNGELLFTKYGISGPASLDVSRAVNERVLAGETPEVAIDLFPATDDAGLAELLDTVLADGERTLAFGLLGILKERMPEIFLSLAGLDGQARADSLSPGARARIVRALQDVRVAPGTPRPFAEAVVAAGGVDVDEINPATMESRRVKGLYITGELLDIDGDSGGYNLQFAWSTGALAGIALGRAT